MASGAAPSKTGLDDGSAPGAQVGVQPGDVLAGRYEVRERIGAGGMGAVYRALDRTKEEEIAVKVLLPSLLEHAEARERFMTEAKVSTRLSHPHVVNVFDVQEHEGSLFLTMELLHGRSLREVLDQCQEAGASFTAEEALEMLGPIAEALAYAHETTVHRDVKPENIFLGDDGKPKLMDFGIARLLRTSQLTRTSQAMGTAYYMSPEQIKGSKNVDHRADQYALGPRPEQRHKDMRAFLAALGACGLPTWLKLVAEACVLLAGSAGAVHQGLVPGVHFSPSPLARA